MKLSTPSDIMPGMPFRADGISWHAVVLERDEFLAMKSLISQQFGMAAAIDQDGFVMFEMPNGTMLELYEPQNVPSYGYNEGVAFGFTVDDIDAASMELARAGCEMLGKVTRMEQMKYANAYFRAKGIEYAYRHFRAADGRVYGLNEHKIVGTAEA